MDGAGDGADIVGTLTANADVATVVYIYVCVCVCVYLQDVRNCANVRWIDVDSLTMKIIKSHITNKTHNSHISIS